MSTPQPQSQSQNSDPTATTTTTSTQPEQSPSQLLNTAIKSNSRSQTLQALTAYAAAFTHHRNKNNNNNHDNGVDVVSKKMHQIRSKALHNAVRGGSAAVVSSLLDDGNDNGNGHGEEGGERVSVGDVNARDLGAWRDDDTEGDDGGDGKEEGREGKFEAVLRVLGERGWDVNCGEGEESYSMDGHCPIYQICHSERLVRWFLSHGAHVSFPGPDVRGNPPLLEVVARRGTIPTFKLLQSHGAPFGFRCLHSAAESAAFAERNNNNNNESHKAAARMQLVRFLVEDVGCDINGMDVPEGLMPGNHFGSPLNYVAHTGGGEAVARYLLDKGADPRIKDCYGVGDASTYANGNEKVANLLAQWMEKKKD